MDVFNSALRNPLPPLRKKADRGKPDMELPPPEDDDTRKKKNSRRKHRNSHLGCGTCKKRRIKCDENLPQCFNCVKGKLHCAYLNLDAPARNALRMAQYNQNLRHDRHDDSKDDEYVLVPLIDPHYYGYAYQVVPVDGGANAQPTVAQAGHAGGQPDQGIATGMQNIPPNMAQNMGQNMGQNVAQNLGQNISQNITLSIGQNIPQNMPLGVASSGLGAPQSLGPTGVPAVGQNIPPLASHPPRVPVAGYIQSPYPPMVQFQQAYPGYLPMVQVLPPQGVAYDVPVLMASQPMHMATIDGQPVVMVNAPLEHHPQAYAAPYAPGAPLLVHYLPLVPLPPPPGAVPRTQAVSAPVSASELLPAVGPRLGSASERASPVLPVIRLALSTHLADRKLPPIRGDDEPKGDNVPTILRLLS